jgi:hypothetical protein
MELELEKLMREELEEEEEEEEMGVGVNGGVQAMAKMVVEAVSETGGEEQEAATIDDQKPPAKKRSNVERIKVCIQLFFLFFVFFLLKNEKGTILLLKTNLGAPLCFSAGFFPC